MHLKEIKAIFHKELDAIYPAEEVDSFFAMMMEHYLGLGRFVLVLDPHLIITKEEERLFFEGLAQLKLERPIQYILGKAHFMDMDLVVDKNVLIPRPETEELVRWILSEVQKLVRSYEFGVMSSAGWTKDGKRKDEGQKRKYEIRNTKEEKAAQKNKNGKSGIQNSVLSILDIGTGSGCIAIALAKNLPDAKVYALDISKEALKVAKENAVGNGVDIHFKEADILTIDSLPEKFDIIVSNPPYVREQEKDTIKNNVKKYEPDLALFVSDNDPLLFYKRIIQFALGHLKKDGLLFFEINQYLEKETLQLLEEQNFSEIELRKDMFGNYRMLKGKRPSKTPKPPNPQRGKLIGT